MDPFQVVASMLAGLGIFFVGIQTLSNNLRQLTGRRFRMLLEKSTRNPVVSALLGAVIGATMQTGSTITFILVSMVSAGMITVDRSLPVRLGAAVGTSTMVIVATLNIQVFILFLLGASGILLAQVRNPKPILGVLFGGGLLFFGLRMVGSSSASLTELEWFRAIIVSVNDFALGAFLLGAVLSILVQSPQSVAILAIAMTGSGVLSSWTTVAIIYGSNFGGGISTYILSSGFKGTSRQIMVFQMLFNVLTALVLFTLFYVERLGGIPLIHAFVTSLAGDITRQMAVVYLIFNVFGAIMMFMLRGPILKRIEARWPPTMEEDIGKLQFLHDHDLDTPELALELAEKEQQRMLDLIPMYLDTLRLPCGEDKAQGDTTTKALNQLYQALEESLTELGPKVGAGGAEQMISLSNRNRLLGSMIHSLDGFASGARAAKQSAALQDLAAIIVEALDAIVGAASDAAKAGNPEEINAVWNATHDRSDQMRKIRQRLLSGDRTLSDQERMDLMNMTNGLQRSIWMLHEYIGELRVALGTAAYEGTAAV